MKKCAKIAAFVLACAMAVLSFSACGAGENGGNENLLSGYWTVDMEIENYGVIRLRLDADAAPVTVTNFVKLVRGGFYDGLTIHRVVPGFVIQGGAPDRDGTGGSDETIKGEFAANGVTNDLAHVRGAISMARLGSDYNSATSQFFIVQDDSARASLDGKYACFGYVTDGMEIVDRICAEVPVINSVGLVAEENQPVITSVRVVE